MKLRELEPLLSGATCLIWSRYTGNMLVEVVNIKYLDDKLLDKEVLKIDLIRNQIQVGEK